MKCQCAVCGEVYDNTSTIDEREERYNKAYEPYPVTCPECGSDEVS